MKTATPSKLYWSERGAISCAEHAPYRGSDTWNWERWTTLKRADAAAFERELGRAPACETCVAIERRREVQP
jgi:hypothetical protein